MQRSSLGHDHKVNSRGYCAAKFRCGRNHIIILEPLFCNTLGVVATTGFPVAIVVYNFLCGRDHKVVMVLTMRRFSLDWACFGSRCI